MSSRRSSTRFALSAAAALLVAAGAGFAISACSSSTDGGTTAAEAGADATADARIKVDAAPTDEDAAVPETSEQCLARCGKEHPASVAKYNAVDTCWAASCNASCVVQNGMFDAGDDGGDAGDAGLVNDGGTNLCGTEVSSGVDRACDDCTTAFCCPSWKGCYDDADCLEYNGCVNDCP